MVDETGALQASGDLLGRLVFGLEGIDQTQTDQIGEPHLYRHGATVGCTAFAQAAPITRPGIGLIDVHLDDTGFLMH